MFDCYKDGLVHGREEFPLPWILAENALYLATWGLGAALLWPAWTPAGLPVLGIAWILVVLTIQLLLKKHNCSGCHYYDKACHLGWGKLAAAMFPRDSGDPRLGLKLSMFYILSPPLVLLAGVLTRVFHSPGWHYWLLLGLFVLLNVLTFPLRKHGCAQCRMRKVCPGSAAKEQESR